MTGVVPTVTSADAAESLGEGGDVLWAEAAIQRRYFVELGSRGDKDVAGAIDRDRGPPRSVRRGRVVAAFSPASEGVSPGPRG